MTCSATSPLISVFYDLELGWAKVQFFSEALPLSVNCRQNLILEEQTKVFSAFEFYFQASFTYWPKSRQLVFQGVKACQKQKKT